MDRNCNKCIHHTSGSCSAWECTGTVTVEDVKAEALAEVEEAMYHQCFECDNDEDMQKWEGGNWIRYRLFENVVEQLRSRRMSKRDEIIRTYRCTDAYGESCTHDCEECEKENAEMLDDFEKEIRADAIGFIVEKLIYPLLNEYDIDLWKNICYIELAEKWVGIVNARNGEDDYIIKDLEKWIAEQMQKGAGE